MWPPKRWLSSLAQCSAARAVVNQKNDSILSAAGFPDGIQSSGPPEHLARPCAPALAYALGSGHHHRVLGLVESDLILPASGSGRPAWSARSRLAFRVLHTSTISTTDNRRKPAHVAAVGGYVAHALRARYGRNGEARGSCRHEVITSQQR